MNAEIGTQRGKALCDRETNSTSPAYTGNEGRTTA
jgi:hypothetical protein